MFDSGLSDETLMCRFRDTADDGALRELAERHFERAVAFARARLGGDNDACDAVQDALIRVVRHRKRYDPKHAFAPWFYAILRNVCIDRRRKEVRYVGALRRFAGRVLASPESGAATERAEALIECLAQEEVHLLNLRYVEGLSVAETAGYLGCSVEAAKKRLQRVIARLRELAVGGP